MFLLSLLQITRVGMAGDASASPPAPPPVVAGDLYVTSDQPAAHVLLDGVDTGQLAPALLKGVAQGKHSIEARTECARATATVAVSAGLIARSDLVLTAGRGTLDLTTTPPAAVVMIDGAEVGKTPLRRYETACGEHTLAIRLLGYVEVAQPVRLPAFETTTLQFTLAREQFGTLVIGLSQIEAAVVLDGKDLGPGPRTIEHLLSGAHALRVHLDGYAPDERTISVAPDQVTRVDVALALPVVPPPPPPPPPSVLKGLPWGRISLDTAVTGGGVVLGFVALNTYGNARDAWKDYLDVEDDDHADRFYDDEVAPRKTASILEATGSLALLAGAGWLWWTTDLEVAVVPQGATFVLRW